MKKCTLSTFLLSVLILVGFGMQAQNSMWEKTQLTETAESVILDRDVMPDEYNLFKLNIAAFKTALVPAPKRAAGYSNVVIQLPSVNGDLQNFRVYEASVMEKNLQAKHHNIRSYVAQGIDDPTALARFSVSDYTGVNIMISSGKHATVYVDSYTQDRGYYIAYGRDAVQYGQSDFQCYVEEAVEPLPAPENANDGQLRTYRLALAATGEYSQFHLNRQGVDPTASDEVKKAAVLSELNVAMTRINGIFERDLGVTMVIVDDNEELIFLTPASSPYSNYNTFAMLGENQTVCDSLIGTDNYDIGHVFNTGGGGVAYLRSVCVSNLKAGGVTGLPSPVGDRFYVDFTSHEMGHQFGANHSFNGSAGNCGPNRNNSTAVEPGSGSTIMSYAGNCPPQNVQGFSDDYFHAISIQEMWGNVKNGNARCSVNTPTNNSAPTANAGGNHIIPKSTPFMLTGEATDPDGDSLTHSWEQMDQQVAVAPPSRNSTNGPLFRSLKPSDDPVRYFPRMATILQGNTEWTWEVVPAVARNIRFRYTVRDNSPNGGASASANMTVIVNGDSGPFVVTSQNDPTTWQTQTTETITWDVANTDQAPVNASHVDILFSPDNGASFPITLASNVPNNGSAVVNVPNLNTTRGRVMVKGHNNIFFDINDRSITVTGVVGIEDQSFDNFSVYPNPSTGIFNLEMTPAAADKLEISLYDLRGRLINHIEYDEAGTGPFTRQLDYSYVESGLYFLVVSNGNRTATKKLIVK